MGHICTHLSLHIPKESISQTHPPVLRFIAATLSSGPSRSLPAKTLMTRILTAKVERILTVRCWLPGLSVMMI